MSDFPATKTFRETGRFAEACQVVACHCEGLGKATHIIGPFDDDSYDEASKKCAEMHIMAGYRCRPIPVLDYQI